MDFSAINQLRTKKFWWMDVILYFVISLLISTILCYFIFSIKNNQQRNDIQAEIAKMQTVGTLSQKAQEQNVINYRAKISDFSALLKNHEFASNALAFLEQETLPKVWFNQIALDESGATIQLSGEAEDMDTFSRQVAIFENNKYVKNLGTLNSSLGQSSRVEFNVYLGLDPIIFSYLASISPDLNTAALQSSTSPQPQQSQTTSQNNKTANLQTGGQ